MKLLLDTHAFLWFIDGNPLLSDVARGQIEDPTNARYLSIASLWEIAIKLSIGKLSISQPYGTFIPAQLALNNIRLLGITFANTELIATLPLHHRDPFDRLLVVQALQEGLALISADPAFDAYGILRVW
jgi:PIN domain nuclease of toxin-antitoxin system